MKKILLLLLILITVGGSVFAFNINTFPSPIQPGNWLISPALNIGYFGWSGGGYSNNFLIGFAGRFDRAMNFPVAITFGGEVSLNLAAGADSTLMAVPLMFRVAWHPNFEVPNLDVYAAFKLGVGIGIAPDVSSSDIRKFGFAWGTDIGVGYFFNKSIGVFGELGWNYYPLYKWTWTYYSWGVYGYNWFTAGVTFKI